MHVHIEQWNLLNPGCSVPQADNIVFGGDPLNACNSNKDCYGNALCVKKTCVCQMWQGRERFAVTAFNNSLWVFGGYVGITLDKCGTSACNSNYRSFMNDIWSSPDGVRWTQHLPTAHNGPIPMWRGRGEVNLCIICCCWYSIHN